MREKIIPYRLQNPKVSWSKRPLMNAFLNLAGSSVHEIHNWQVEFSSAKEKRPKNYNQSRKFHSMIIIMHDWGLISCTLSFKMDREQKAAFYNCLRTSSYIIMFTFHCARKPLLRFHDNGYKWNSWIKCRDFK